MAERLGRVCRTVRGVQGEAVEGLRWSAQEGLGFGDYLSHSRFGEPTDEVRLADFPVEAFDLVAQRHATHGQTFGQARFKRIAFLLAGDRTK